MILQKKICCDKDIGTSVKFEILFSDTHVTKVSMLFLLTFSFRRYFIKPFFFDVILLSLIISVLFF